MKLHTYILLKLSQTIQAWDVGLMAQVLTQSQWIQGIWGCESPEAIHLQQSFDCSILFSYSRSNVYVYISMPTLYIHSIRGPWTWPSSLEREVANIQKVCEFWGYRVDRSWVSKDFGSQHSLVRFITVLCFLTVVLGDKSQPLILFLFRYDLIVWW